MLLLGGYQKLGIRFSGPSVDGSCAERGHSAVDHCTRGGSQDLLNRKEKRREWDPTGNISEQTIKVGTHCLTLIELLWKGLWQDLEAFQSRQQQLLPSSLRAPDVTSGVPFIVVQAEGR